MREENGQLVKPEFAPQIPAHLLTSLPESERWLYERVSIQGQQNEWLIERAMKADARQIEIEGRVESESAKSAQEFANLGRQIRALELVRVIFGEKWKFVTWLLAALVLPILVIVIGAWVAAKLHLKE